MWLAARTVESGKLDPAVAHVASQIDNLRQQVSQGLLKSTKKADYFGENKRRRLGSSVKVVEGLQSEVKNLQSMVEMLQKQILELHSTRESQGEQNNVSRHDSCSLKESHSFSEPDKGEWKKCQLYWPSLKFMVAKGRAFIPAIGSYTIIHGRNVDPTSQLKVNVDIVVSGYESVQLPFPNGDDDCNTIQDALGGFIACRYMREIMEAGTTKISKQYFEGSPSTYEDEHIKEIHTKWLEYVEPLVRDQINKN